MEFGKTLFAIHEHVCIIDMLKMFLKQILIIFFLPTASTSMAVSINESSTVDDVYLWLIKSGVSVETSTVFKGMKTFYCTLD